MRHTYRRNHTSACFTTATNAIPTIVRWTRCWLLSHSPPSSNPGCRPASATRTMSSPNMTAPSLTWDAAIQSIFTALEQLGIMDDTIIALNGDHGETLYDHECWFDHHRHLRQRPACAADHPVIRASCRPAGASAASTSTRTCCPPCSKLAGLADDAEKDGYQFDGRSLMSLARGEEASFESEFLHQRMHLDAQARLAQSWLES